jgi:hypothetical protein
MLDYLYDTDFDLPATGRFFAAIRKTNNGSAKQCRR